MLIVFLDGRGRRDGICSGSREGWIYSWIGCGKRIIKDDVGLFGFFRGV